MVKRSTNAKLSRGADRNLAAIRGALESYQARHPEAKVHVKRTSSATIRVRVVDPCFEGVALADRDDELWELLGDAPEDALAELSLLVTLAPNELADSMANLAFEQRGIE